VNVFDGKNEKLIEKVNVLVEDNKITTISARKTEANGATIIRKSKDLYIRRFQNEYK